MRTAKFTILSLLIILTITAEAQLRFQKTIGGPVLDWANSIEQTADFGYIILGSTKNFGAGQEDFYLVKTNEFGDTLWTRAFGGAADDEEGTAVRIADDGGYIVSGTTQSFGAGMNDFYLLKTDSTGNLLWSKTYGGSTIDICTGIEKCYDGGFLVYGKTNSFGAGGYDGWLIRTNSTGDTLWTKTIGTASLDEIYDVKQISDSGFIATGTSVLPGMLKEATLIKLDINGNIIWSKAYGTPIEEIGHSVVQTSDGGYFIGAETVVTASISADMYLIKTDANGDTLWTRFILAGANDVINSVLQNADGGYTIAGFTNSFGLGGDDLALIRTNSQGQVQWVEVIGGFSIAKDEARMVRKTADGGFIAAGYTQSFGAGGGTDFFLVKTDSTGFSGCNNVNVSFNEQVASSSVNSSTGIQTLVPIFTLTNPATIQNKGGGVVNVACTTVGVMQISSQNKIGVYPNPFNTSAKVEIKIDEPAEGAMFVLTDMQGREVTKLVLSNTTIGSLNGVLYKKNLSPGMYFFTVKTSTDSSNPAKVLGTGKIVIQ